MQGVVDGLALAEELRVPDEFGLDVVELGLGRAGLRTAEAARRVAQAALAAETPRLFLSGTAAYEGAAATSDPAETRARIAALLAETAAFHRSLRAMVGPDRQLLLTAGGSVFFDLVLAGLKPVADDCAPTRLVLRSGAIFFHDHGIYQRGMEALDARQGLVVGGKAVSAAEGFRPALRVWAEVLSVPEPRLAICGMGLRDVAIDQGLPIPLRAYRDDAPTGGEPGSISTEAYGAASADELTAIADAARAAADGDVVSLDADRDGTWDVQLVAADGSETDVRVDVDGTVTVTATEAAEWRRKSGPAPEGTE